MEKWTLYGCTPLWCSSLSPLSSSFSSSVSSSSSFSSFSFNKGAHFFWSPFPLPVPSLQSRDEECIFGLSLAFQFYLCIAICWLHKVAMSFCRLFVKQTGQHKLWRMINKISRGQLSMYWIMDAECFPYCCLVPARLPWPGGAAQRVLCGLGPLLRAGH